MAPIFESDKMKGAYGLLFSGEDSQGDSRAVPYVVASSFLAFAVTYTQVCDVTVFALNYCLPCNYCLPSTTVRPQLLFALKN
jgi:hypothetical protein